jgi:NADH pyrophosphatase NudC (nudix superfamily)
MSEDREFEKYGVEEVDGGAKTASEGTDRFCPWCGKKLERMDTTNVLKCPEHGTAPFEGTRE